MRLLVEASNVSLGVEDGHIVPVTGTFDVVIRVSDGELRPGLINSHEHLHRNHYGRLGTPPYRNVYEWGADIHIREASAIERARALPREMAHLIGAEKNLRAGVTTVVHHDPWETMFDCRFPIRVLKIHHLHSLRTSAVAECAGRAGRFMIHLSEGVDEASAEEVRELDRAGLLTRDLLAVHAIGVDRDGVRRLRAADAAVIWCPTSNYFLYGRTVPAELLEPGIDALLGSDSLLSGAGTLLEEIHFARETGLLSDARLEDAVGSVAARRLGLAAPSLANGAVADFAIFRKPLLEAAPSDVALVVAAGDLRVLDPSLTPSLGEWERLGTTSKMAGVVRWISLAPQNARAISEPRRDDLM